MTLLIETKQEAMEYYYQDINFLASLIHHMQRNMNRKRHCTLHEDYFEKFIFDILCLLRNCLVKFKCYFFKDNKYCIYSIYHRAFISVLHFICEQLFEVVRLHCQFYYTDVHLHSNLLPYNFFTFCNTSVACFANDLWMGVHINKD